MHEDYILKESIYRLTLNRLKMSVIQELIDVKKNEPTKLNKAVEAALSDLLYDLDTLSED